MKKLLTVLSIAAIMATTAAPAEAGRKGAYILGGVLGGLVLGGILHNNAQAAPAAPQPVYVRPQPIYEQRCWNEPRSQWNSYQGGYVTYYVQRCETYRIN